RAMAATHEVFNVPEPWTGANLFSADRGLTGLLQQAGLGAEDFERLALLGELAGTPAAQDWARLANSYPPVLRSHDRYGHRIDEVDYHPSWHELMTVAVANGLHATPWSGTAGQHPHLARATGFYVWSQLEQGHLCPI